MTTEPKSIQTGLRIPQDLIRAMDALRVESGLSRSEIIVAALRAHLGVRAPAETIGERK